MATTNVLIYTSPFQRCIDTSLGIARHLPNTILRLELGLGEWMCERFFEDDLAPASRLLARQQETLARKQAEAFSSIAKNNNNINKNGNTATKTTLLPWVDYGYQALRTEFDFPEHYGDMLRRFDDTRLHCMATAATTTTIQPFSKNNKNDNSNSNGGISNVVVLFITHAVGVNALLDGFRNQLTRPIETGYCSISRVTRVHPSKSTTLLTSPLTPPPPLPSPKEEKDSDDFHNAIIYSEWTVDLLASDIHIVDNND
ncbi:hypothetical protein BDC45DRAFT_498745 [Circinella umbellata]|nr:hypothetical protein BDC45DRAFT_498745 [Circinella umbellata]